MAVLITQDCLTAISSVEVTFIIIINYYYLHYLYCYSAIVFGTVQTLKITVFTLNILSPKYKEDTDRLESTKGKK